ncbi:MAG: SRPBCC domain-containing protein [Acidiferrobacterales bacterium]|nr:SRPBCC domain-containing protein [Acidiferrobacterales bacterium]
MSKVEPSVIKRQFNAPRQLVFDAWTKVEHLNHWMFPMQGCTCEFVSADIRDNGSSLHKITMPNGHEMWLYTKYEEVNSPDRLVFLQYMSNQEGEIVHANPVPNWPKDMLATLTFEDIDENNTQLTFLWEPVDPTEEEIKAFEETRAQHESGWGAGMAQLENYLGSLDA